MAFVYFFKHKESSGIKIGMTTKDDVQERFKAFKTYAPYGAEILGTIETFNAALLEKTLHKDFADRRMEGEFFDIHPDEITEICERYSGNERIVFFYFTVLIRVSKKAHQRIIFIESENILHEIYNYYGHGFEIFSQTFVETSKNIADTFNDILAEDYCYVLPTLNGKWFEVKKKKNHANK